MVRNRKFSINGRETRDRRQKTKHPQGVSEEVETTREEDDNFSIFPIFPSMFSISGGLLSHISRPKTHTPKKKEKRQGLI